MNKKLKHIKVYDKLYEFIQDGTYPAGSQLPSETTLSAQMGVSRMTLRKALTLLQDDGLTKNVHGVGHFVCASRERKENNTNITIVSGNPVYNYSTDKFDNVRFDYRIERPTKSITDSLERYTPAVVIADRWYGLNEETTAYSLSIIPIDAIGENHIDLNDKHQLLDYLQKGCYEQAAHCTQIMTHSAAGNFSAKDYILSDKDSFLLIQENIYDENNRIIISNKHYIPSEKFRIVIEL